VTVETDWTISEATARRLESTPWPDEPKPPKGPVAAQASKPPEKIEAEVKAERRAEHAKAIQEMED
jgi:hypothetical protein